MTSLSELKQGKYMKKPLTIFIAVLVFSPLACSRESLVWVPMWQETSSLGTPRAGAASVAALGFIYVIGGVDGKNFLRTTEYAEILEDGSLGPWKPGPLMNEARGFADAVIYQGSIYVVGGGKGRYGKTLLSTAERSRILPDGSLSPWAKEKYSMNMPRRCSKLVVVGDRIFTLGGFGGDMLNTVEHATFLGNGTLDEWFEEQERLTVLRYINGAKTVGDITYVIGGHHQTEGVGIKDVEWSKVIDAAGFKNWQRTSPLRIGRYGLAVAAHKDNLYALGGLSGTAYLDSIELTTAGSNGELEAWRLTTPLSSFRSLFNAVVYKDWIYILGGTNDTAYFKSVEYATFNKTGDIGFWSTREKAAATKKSMKKEGAKSRPPLLPNEGVVVKTMNTKRYVYILVSKQEGEVWLAAPKEAYHAGDRIRYGAGVSMPNFYSKELKINFPSVIFVGKVHKLDAK